MISLYPNRASYSTDLGGGIEIKNKMAAENAKRGIKRFLEQSTSDRVDQGESKCSCVKSKRLKTMFHLEIAGGSNECQNEIQSGDDDQNVTQDGHSNNLQGYGDRRG
ncbi:uncharacterized protein LOC133739689 isoform X2 [Rosa rugosa]|uniref:uncharacterized protein LOC133739689 isoform X2 n=1 Tax=Rosa rugosa TaxID=74645 RepID=UPI002B40B3A3|nr:uncharacterized protein LOC133739689 isoform X2 [Rosa rugosa]